MKVLLTGASSFTGLWFAAALADAGAEVTAALRSPEDAYDGVRRERVRRLGQKATVVHGCGFGSEPFIELLGSGFDVLCHHAAEVSNYRSLDFDVAAAVASNTHAARTVLERFGGSGGSSVIVTGSVFEAGEGLGEEPVRAFSPYGLSKGLSADVLRFWSGQAGLAFGKFVIANPFGPFEEPRFCRYVVDCWRRGEDAEVRTPDYLRDNIHVDLLAKAYARFALERPAAAASRHLGPMGYVETQGAFAQRFAREMTGRLSFARSVRLAKQTEFPEPLVRTNRDRIDAGAFGWSESDAWDAVADYYRPDPVSR